MRYTVWDYLMFIGGGMLAGSALCVIFALLALKGVGLI